MLKIVNYVKKGVFCCIYYKVLQKSYTLRRAKRADSVNPKQP